jgi:5-formyltetrahydrofolate cyclo-ligase
MFYKPEIRNKMRARRKSLDAIAMTQAAQAVGAKVVQIKEFLEATHIGCYLSIEGELDPMPILHCAHDLHKKLYLPVIRHDPKSGEILEYHHYAIGDPLMKGEHGISGSAHRTQLPYSLEKLDLILTPLVAFDSHGNRLGRGAGHYDRTLNEVKGRTGKLPILMGLAYEFQKIPQIVTDKWDVPLDIIVTENNVYYRGA